MILADQKNFITNLITESYWHNNHNENKNLGWWRGCFVPNRDTNASPMIFWKNSWAFRYAFCMVLTLALKQGTNIKAGLVNSYEFLKTWN